MNKISKYQLATDTALFDKRYGEEVYVVKTLRDNRVLLTTETGEWKDSTEYGATLPLDSERFKIPE